MTRIEFHTLPNQNKNTCKRHSDQLVITRRNSFHWSFLPYPSNLIG